MDDAQVDFIGQDFPSKADNHHKCIQATILSSLAPLINLWVQLSEQQLSVERGKFVPVEVVLATTNYVSQMRRDIIIDKLRVKEKNLVSWFTDFDDGSLNKFFYMCSGFSSIDIHLLKYVCLATK